MDSDAPHGLPVLRLVDAPSSFAQRVLAAIPGASLIFADRLTGPLPSEAAGVAILYERSEPDQALVATLSAQMPTLVVSERPTTEDALACLDHGADGFLDSALDQRALRNALLGVAAGELAYGREVLGLWLRLRQQQTARQRVALGPRERELIDLIASGATDKEIAARYGLPKSTVQKQIVRLRRRIGARNRAAAVAIRERLGA
jgi:DNA-binding NarL/FixJ family response regulator